MFAVVSDGRPEEDVKRCLVGLTPLILDRTAERQRADIQIFFTVRLLPNLKGVQEADKPQIVSLLANKADGVFLAARLICQLLLEQEGTSSAVNNVSAVEKLLASSKGEDFI